jgi:dethiobiotin synthetase
MPPEQLSQFTFFPSDWFLSYSWQGAYFVTGTDTGVGKTTVSCLLLKYWLGQGMKTGAFKPVQTGYFSFDDPESDVSRLSEYAFNSISEMNMYHYSPPIAPHLAATYVSDTICIDCLALRCHELSASADVLIVEGAGGWAVPLNDQYEWSDFVKSADLSVIMVVGMRLGVINHALLTARMIELQSKGSLVGWIANQLDPDQLAYEDNKKTLQDKLCVPYLGEVRNIKESSLL